MYKLDRTDTIALTWTLIIVFSLKLWSQVMRVVAQRNVLTHVTTESMFISSLSYGDALDTTLKQQRDASLQFLQDKKVPFKEIYAATVKIYKEKGIYVKTMFNGKNRYQPFSELVKAKVKWACEVQRFIKWSNRSYDNYGITKGDTVLTDKELKAKELKKVVNAWKTISDLFCDSEDAEVLKAMKALDAIIKVMVK